MKRMLLVTLLVLAAVVAVAPGAAASHCNVTAGACHGDGGYDVGADIPGGTREEGGGPDGGGSSSGGGGPITSIVQVRQYKYIHACGEQATAETCANGYEALRCVDTPEVGGRGGDYVALMTRIYPGPWEFTGTIRCIGPWTAAEEQPGGIESDPDVTVTAPVSLWEHVPMHQPSIDARPGRGLVNLDATFRETSGQPFAVNHTVPVMNDVVSVTVTMQAHADTFLWSFGDGGTASGREVQHTYAGKGAYTVTLTPYWVGSWQVLVNGSPELSGTLARQAGPSASASYRVLEVRTVITD